MDTDQTPSLRRNFSWTLWGNIVFAFGQWVVLAIVSKLGSETELGRLSLALAVTTPIFTLSRLQLRPVIASDVEQVHSLGTYAGLRVLSVVLAITASGVIGYAFFRSDQAAIILLMAGAKAIDSICDVYYGFAQQRERLDIVGRSMSIRGITTGLLVYLAYSSTGSLAIAVIAMGAAWVLPFILLDLIRLRTLNSGDPGSTARNPLRPSKDWSSIRGLAWRAAPLGVVMMLISLRVQVPRFFVEHHFGEATLGVFAAISYGVVVGMTVTTALSQATIPRLARHHLDGRRKEFIRLVLKSQFITIGFGLGSVVAAALFGDHVLRLLYTPTYAAYQQQFVMLMAVGAVMYAAGLLGAPVTAMGRFRIQMWIHLLAAATILGASSYLVPRRGIDGAIIASGITAVLLLVCYVGVVWQGIAGMKSEAAAAQSK